MLLIFIQIFVRSSSFFAVSALASVLQHFTRKQLLADTV